MAIPPFDPASEPLGSFHPVVRRINSTNFDLAMHSPDKTWVDRFNEIRKTWAAIETEIEGLLIAGGKIFDTEEEGRLAAEDGQYFFAASDDPNVSKTLYKRISSSESQWIADDPSAEFVKGAVAASTAAIDLASRPGAEKKAFRWRGGYASESVEPLIVSESGSVIFAAENGLPINQLQKSFNWKRRQAWAFSIALGDRHVARYDKNGQPVVDYRRVFAWKSSALAGSQYLHVDKNGVVFDAWDGNGTRTIGGGGGGLPDLGTLPISDQYINPGDPWLSRSALHVGRQYDPIYPVPVRDIFATHVEVYAYLDALMSEHPDYVTSELLGLDDFDNEVRAYRFRTADFTGNGNSYPQSEVEYPKIVVVGAVHGNESHTVKANLQFAADLCRRWKEDPRLTDLRWSSEIVLIPVASPSAYNAVSRVNGNGVNVNRNTPTGWEDGGSDDPSSSNYKGPSPASEPETQYMISVMQEPSVTALIDHHMFGSMSNESATESIWMGVRGARPVAVGAQMIAHDAAWMRRHYDYVWQDNTPTGRLALSSDGTMARQADAEGIGGYLLETPNRFLQGSTFEVHRHAVEAITQLTYLIHKTEINARSLVN